MFKLKLLKLYYKLSYNLLPSYFDRYRDIIEQDPGRVLRINYIHPPLIRRVYAECSLLFQLIKLINNIRAETNDANQFISNFLLQCLYGLSECI